MWGRIVLAVVVALLAAISEFIGPGTAGADWPGSRDRDAGDRV
jgi:hypothetical protein